MIKRTEASSLLLLRATSRRGFAPLAILLLCLPSIGFAHAFASIGGETQQDANVTAAEQNFFEGQQLLTEGSLISKQKAIEKFGEALVWSTIRSARSRRRYSLISKRFLCCARPMIAPVKPLPSTTLDTFTIQSESSRRP